MSHFSLKHSIRCSCCRFHEHEEKQDWLKGQGSQKGQCQVIRILELSGYRWSLGATAIRAGYLSKGPTPKFASQQAISSPFAFWPFPVMTSSNCPRPSLAQRAVVWSDVIQGGCVRKTNQKSGSKTIAVSAQIQNKNMLKTRKRNWSKVGTNTPCRHRFTFENQGLGWRKLREEELNDTGCKSSTRLHETQWHYDPRPVDDDSRSPNKTKKAKRK